MDPSPGSPAERLTHLLERGGRSQVAVAKQLGIQPNTLNRVASGAISMTAETAERLAAHFGVRAGWLLFGEGEAPAGLAEAYAAGFRDALDTAKAAMEARAIAIATGQAPPVAEEGIEPLRSAIPRTLPERLRADAEAIQADAKIRRRRPPG